MQIISDLQLHSKYSRAVSQKMDLFEIARWASKKGIQLVATGDWTHPLWFRHITENLQETNPGIYSLKKKPADQKNAVSFFLSTEISSIYSQGEQVRRVHNLIFSPSIETCQKIIKKLQSEGANLMADGRPIVGISSKDLLEMVLEIDENVLFVPAHVWTPWFALYGSKSGFDSIEQCFGSENAKHIYAIETGLSSDPLLNWQIKELENRSIVSFSDAHCLHPDSFIYLAKGGIRRIADLKEADKLLSLDFVNDLRIKTSTISHIYKFPTPSHLYQIKTHSWELSATPNHRFFVLDNEKMVEKRASELKINDLIACVRKVKMGKKRAARLFSPKFRQRVVISRDGLVFLKKKRLELGCSAKTVSFKLSKNKDFIWMIETGRIRSVKTDIFKKLSNLYNFGYDKFVKKFKVTIFPKIQIPLYTNSKLCQILGYSLGDGGIKHRGKEKRGFTLTDKDIDLLSFYEKLISNIFKVETRLEKSNSRNSYSVFLPYNLLLFFEHIAQGIFAPSNKRMVPPIVFRLPKYQLASFLKGFYDAEGTFDNHGLSLCSSSKILLRQIQYLLLKFGLLSAIYSDFEKNKKKYRYKLIIYGQDQLKIFAQKIGFESLPKKKKLLNYISSLTQKAKDSGKDFLPLGQIIKQGVEDLRLRITALPKNLQNFFYKGFKGLRRRNVKQFLEFFEKSVVEVQTMKFYRVLKCFADSDICWEPIKSLIKEKANCQFVYDLTSPKYQNYVVNGIITHNSGPKLGREATVFVPQIQNSEFRIQNLTYNDIAGAIRQDAGAKLKIGYTIEFFPEEGKYHWSGHRVCNIRYNAQEVKEKGKICPVCHKPLTIGVENRVLDLSYKSLGQDDLLFLKNKSDLTFVYDKEKKWKPFVSLIPLLEILTEIHGGSSIQALRVYESLTSTFGTEFDILMKKPYEEIEAHAGDKLRQAIEIVRNRKVFVDPGYDGVFGVVKIFNSEKTHEKNGGTKEAQQSLF